MRIPRRVFLAASLLAVAGVWLAAGGPSERVTITLLGTTDLHGNLFPVDYYRNQPAARGLAKIAALVRQARQQNPHTLLLDCGDTIQGTPLAYYFRNPLPPQQNPTIAAMNAMGYDAMAVGNHEFNFGLQPLLTAKRQAHFPWLAANIRQTKADVAQAFLPYVEKTVAGVRVGIVGFITPGVPRWEIPAHYDGYEFEPIVDAARRVVPEVRKKVDLLVVIAHSGLGRNPETGEDFPSDIPGENAIWELAEQVPGIDVILFGHSHQELPEKLVNGVLLAQPKNWAQSLARVDVEMERAEGGRWHVAAKRSQTIPVTDQTPLDADVVRVAQSYHDETQRRLDAPVATSEKEMDGLTARYEDHPLVDLIHQVQLEYGQADVSMATMFLPAVRIPQGPVTVRQLAALYIYENTLYTVEMTGAQLREALEHAASYFPAWPHPQGQRMRLPGYNADAAQGVSYVVDLTQPAGQRIRDLRFRGAPLDPARKLRVAINNYRYSGGGRYRVYQGLPVLYRSPQEVRELLIEYVTRRKTIPTTADGNWRLEPRAALEAILREAQSRDEPPRSFGASAAPRVDPATYVLTRVGRQTD